MNRANKALVVVLGSVLVLLLLTFVGCIAVVAQGPSERASKSEETTEETTERSPSRPEPPAPEEKPPRPEPRTPEEKIRANVEDLGRFQRSEPDDPQKVWVNFYNDNGCLDVEVKYRTSEPLLGLLTQAVTTEEEMKPIYEAIHADRETHETVCDVTVAAYGDPADDYGQKTEEVLYQTTITRDTASRVNWSNVGSVNFRAVWRVDYVHPEVEDEEFRENEREIVDCAHDREIMALVGQEC